MPSCFADKCSNSCRKGLRMFRFPADKERRKKWSLFCRRDETPGNDARLCEAHFEESQFELKRQDGWKKLKPNAIPTLFVTNLQKPLALQIKREVIDENDDQSDLQAAASSSPASSENMILSTPQPSSNEFRSRCSPRKRQAPPPQTDGMGNVTIVKVQPINDDAWEKWGRTAPPLTHEIGMMAAAEKVESVYSELWKRQLPSPPSTNGVLTTMAAKKLDSVNEDPFDTYGKHIADRLRKISPDQIIFVQKLISDVLFEGEIKSLNRNCRIIDTELEIIP